jgi:hypothetical protein
VDVGADVIALKCVPRTHGALVHEYFAVASSFATSTRSE